MSGHGVKSASGLSVARPSTMGSEMNRKLVALFVVALCVGGVAAVGLNKADSRVAPGTKSEPIRIIQIAGEGAEIGRGHGKELAESIKLLHENYLKVVFKKEETRKR